MRYRLRRDLNDKDITEAVKLAGFAVIDFCKAGESIPDKLAVRSLHDGTAFVCWLEIKSKSGRLSEGQRAFRDIWQPRGEWIEARDPEDTVKQLTELYQAKIRQEHWR